MSMFNRAAPRTGSQSTYVARISAGRNLRPIVMVFAFLAAFYTLFAAIGNFRNISTDHQEHQSKLATFSLIFGILYIVVFAFQAFGVAATLSQRVPLVRLYAMLSIATIAIAAAVGILEIVVHFTMKNAIIKECSDLTANDTVVFYSGFFGPVGHTVISQTDAQQWCTDEYDHDSWANIVALLIILFIASMFSLFAYAYYRQLLDPVSAANVVRTPLRGPPSGYPSHYNPAYNASVPSLGYQYGQYGQYPPPPGPPPAVEDADSKPPGYVGGYGYEVDDNNVKENPFADFDERVDQKAGGSEEEHDVTSRPAPGGRDAFV